MLAGWGLGRCVLLRMSPLITIPPPNQPKHAAPVVGLLFKLAVAALLSQGARCAEQAIYMFVLIDGSSTLIRCIRVSECLLDRKEPCVS